MSAQLLPELPHTRIVCTGSRDFFAMDVVISALEQATGERPDDKFFIIHGDAPKGADALVQRYAHSVGNWLILRYAANWANGRGAGIRRNHEMIDLGCDVLLAFAQPCTKPNCKRMLSAHYSHGTSDTVSYAHKKGVTDIRCFDVDGNQIPVEEFLM